MQPRTAAGTLLSRVPAAGRSIVMVPVPNESAGSRARLNLPVHRVQFTIRRNSGVNELTQPGLVGVARNHMDMHVEHLLTSRLTGRRQQVDAIRGKPLHEQPCNGIYGRSDLGQRARLADHVDDMPFRYDQRVATMPGADVEKSHSS